MASVSNLLITINLHNNSVIIGAGHSATDASNGVFSTQGPVRPSQRPLIDEVFCKILTALYGEQGTITLKTSDNDPALIINDVSFPLPCTQHHVATVMNTAAAVGTDPNLAAMEMIRTIMANLPASADPQVKTREIAPKKATRPAKKAARKKKDHSSD